MSNDEKARAINELAPIGKRLREREEEIIAGKKSLYTVLCTLGALARQQAKDLLLAKTKLAGGIRWSEWLGAHAPNLEETTAAKYERIDQEQMDDARQFVFAFIPPPEPKPKPDRAKPSAWEIAWGFISRLERTVRDNPADQWPREQLVCTLDQVEGIESQLRKALGEGK